jgi:hypothetical protein
LLSFGLQAGFSLLCGISQTPRHSIAEPEQSILSQEIAPRFSVPEGPSPRFGSSPPPLSGQSGMKKLGVGEIKMILDKAS